MATDHTISRRAFLSFGSSPATRPRRSVVHSGATAMGPTRSKRAIPMHRPPGAVEENQFLERCTRCNDCRQACPHDAIVPAPGKYGEAAGTPTILAQDAPCYMCKDTPCIAACGQGALSATVPIAMGTARIQPMDCLAHQQQICTVCYEHCPVPHAISLESGRPVINEATCTGCGVCAYVCPAPRNAILLMPARTRPAN